MADQADDLLRVRVEVLAQPFDRLRSMAVATVDRLRVDEPALDLEAVTVHRAGVDPAARLVDAAVMSLLAGRIGDDQPQARTSPSQHFQRDRHDAADRRLVLAQRYPRELAHLGLREPEGGADAGRGTAAGRSYRAERGRSQHGNSR